MKFRKLLGLFFLSTFLFSCGHGEVKGGATSARREPWPIASKGEKKISKLEQLDLSLRVLALELTQKSEGDKSYYFQFLPKEERIEARCILNDSRASISERSPDAVDFEFQTVRAGIEELLRSLDLMEHFTAENNLAIRLEIPGKKARDVALFEGGKIRWLTVPARN